MFLEINLVRPKKPARKILRSKHVGKNFLFFGISGLVVGGFMGASPLLANALTNGNFINVASVINRMNQNMWTPLVPSLEQLQPYERENQVLKLGEIEMNGGVPTPSFESVTVKTPGIARTFLTPDTLEPLSVRLASLNSIKPFDPSSAIGPAGSDQFFQPQKTDVSAINYLFDDVRPVAPGQLVQDHFSWDPETKSLSVIPGQ